MKSKLLLASALSILTIGALCLPNAALADTSADTTGYAFLSCVSDISEGELSETKNDASVLNDVLSMDYYHFDVKRFRNSQADVSDGSASAALDSFVKAFQDAADRAGKSEDKPFVAYLAGHMFVKDGELYYPLVDYDGEEGSEKVTACPATKICEIMRNCKASVKILFVDCCFSGAGNWDGAFWERSRISLRL
jgi:hypothetical protein